MTQAVQLRKGTTSEHSTFTGLQAEATVDTTKKTIVVHDGSTAGGIPLSREDLSNANPSNLTTIVGADTASGDLFVVYDVSASAFKKITRAELNNAMEQDALASVVITGGSINGTTIGASTASTGAFTTLSASSTVTLSGGTANGVLYLDGSKVATSGSALTFDGTKLTAAAVVDSGFTIVDNADITKKAAFEVSGVTTATTRTLTVPNASGTLALLSGTQTFSGATTFSSSFTLSGTTINIALGTSQTTGTWTAGGTTQTGAITLGRSTGAQTVNIATGATTNGTTKTINFGTDGLSGSTTTINYGSAVSGALGAHIWNIGEEKMRLTSTGLGIGTSSPGARLHSYNASGAGALILENGANTGVYARWKRPNREYYLALDINNNGGNDFSLYDATAAATRWTVDSSGNLGLGVTPSAWYASGSGWKALQVGAFGILSNTATNDSRLMSNAYLNTGGSYIYLNSSQYATNYIQISGQHQWYTAPSGTAGNAISFTQAMTLDASGNLGVGETSPASYGKLALYTSGNIALSIRNTVNEGNISVRQSAYGAAASGDVSLYTAGAYAVCLVADNANGYIKFATGSSGGTERARITSGGEFYIAGTTDQGAYNLQCNGTGVWGAGAYVNGSDERLKDDIQSLDSCLNVVNALRPVTFKYKPEHSKDQSVQTGFIAQELQQVLAGKPYLEGLVQEGPQHLNVAYQNIIPLLTKAIQEQQALIESLTSRVAQLEGTQP